MTVEYSLFDFLTGNITLKLLSVDSIAPAVLRNFAGNVHYIRNGQIDIVTNMTKDYSRYIFNIGVAYCSVFSTCWDG